MRIEQIDIENFQLFSQQSFTFDPQFTLVLGVNGSGKTSLLRALAVALGGWAHAYIKDERNHRPIEPGEMRQVLRDQRFDTSKTTSITARGLASIIDRGLDEKEGRVVWARRRNEGDAETKVEGSIRYGNYPTEYRLNFAYLGADALAYIEKGEHFAFPMIAFYECDRIWKSGKNLDPEQAARQQYSRFDAYLDCFHTGANHHDLAAWVLKNEMASLQKRQDTPVLLALKQAASMALENCTGLRFDFEESRVMVEFKDGGITPFEHLSDGQRTLLGLFCDLARRAAILNPHLGGEAAAKTAGVVLIDELDLHLHPRWQRTVISNLRRTFPLMQFICTTHSPFLIQSVLEPGNGSLLVLGPGKPLDGRASIEDIAEEIQGVPMPSRSQRYLDMMQAAENYLLRLQEAQVDDAQQLASLKQELDRLSAPFADDPAFQAVLKLERMAKLGE